MLTGGSEARGLEEEIGMEFWFLRLAGGVIILLSLIDGAVDGQVSRGTEAGECGSSKPDGSGTEIDHEGIQVSFGFTWSLRGTEA